MSLLIVRDEVRKKNMAMCAPIGYLRFAMYCGKMHRRHLFSVRWSERRMAVFSSIFPSLSVYCIRMLQFGELPPATVEDYATPVAGEHILPEL